MKETFKMGYRGYSNFFMYFQTYEAIPKTMIGMNALHNEEIWFRKLCDVKVSLKESKYKQIDFCSLNILIKNNDINCCVESHTPT